jgi:hypothetical protein
MEALKRLEQTDIDLRERERHTSITESQSEHPVRDGSPAIWRNRLKADRINRGSLLIQPLFTTDIKWVTKIIIRLG